MAMSESVTGKDRNLTWRMAVLSIVWLLMFTVLGILLIVFLGDILMNLFA